MAASVFDSLSSNSSNASLDASGIMASLAKDTTGSQRSNMAQYAIQRASTFLQAGRTDEALQAFQQARGIDPQNLTAINYIGKINLSKNNNGEAIKAYQDLVKIQPNSVDAHMSLGNAYLQDNQLVESEKEFQAASRLSPRDPLPNYTLGMQYLQQGRVSEAETMFTKVRLAVPGDSHGYYGLGAVYNKQGKSAEAVGVLETALRLQSNFPAASYELGLAYNALGRTDDAKAQIANLTSQRSPLANDLSFEVNTPRMTNMDAGNSDSINLALGGGSPVWYMNTNLVTANATEKFSINIKFSTQMDAASVMNPSNWNISRANSVAGGYYNNSAPINTAKEASVAPIPVAVDYNDTTRTATVRFYISQNSSADATIDPSHLVFKFSGKDAYGRSMDTTADQIDGYAGKAF